MHLWFGVTLFPVLPREQAAHGSPGSAKSAAGMKPPALETAEGLGSSPCPARASSKCLPCPGAKGEMHLWETSHLAGEKHGLSVGLQRRFAGGLLPKEGCVGPGPCCANPGAASSSAGTALGGVSWGSGERRAGQASPPACASLKTSSPESCQRWQLENTPEKPAASSATGPITAPSFGDFCKQNKEDERLMHRPPDSHELGCDTSPPLGYVADIIHCSRLTCHRSALEQSGLRTSGSSQLSAATRLQICQFTKDPNYTHLRSLIHC